MANPAFPVPGRARMAVLLAVALLVAAAFGEAAPASAARAIVERLSISSGGGQANAGGDRPDMSADGRFVAFQSRASNLIVGDTNNSLDIYLRDRITGTTTRVSLANGGAQIIGASSGPAVSGDGRYVAFTSRGPELTTPLSPFNDVFVRDIVAGTTTLASLSTTAGAGEARAWTRT